MTKVKVDLQCCFCGECQILKTSPTRKAIVCTICKQLLFLEYSTGVKGELDNRGFYFYAYEPFRYSDVNKDINSMFVEE